MKKYQKWERFPLGSIRAEGFLREQLLRGKDGMAGHLYELEPKMIYDPFVHKSYVPAWGDGDQSGWGAEISGNFWTGYIEHAFTLGDDEMIATATDWVNKMLKNQKADGYLGTYFEEDAEEAKRDEDDDVDDEENDTEGDHFTGSERIIGFDEETGCYIVAHYRKSFEAKLIQSRPNIKQYYSELKNALLSYGGTKSRISWAADSFSNERTPIAKINVKTKTVYLYIALNPEDLVDTKYNFVDVSSKKKYASVPVLMKIKGERKFKYALELIDKLCQEKLELPKLEIEDVDYCKAYQTTEEMVETGEVKMLAASIPESYFAEQEAETEAPAEETGNQEV